MSGVAAETEAMADRLQQVLRSAPPGRATRIRQFVLGDISPLLELHTAKAMALLETVIADDPADGIALAMYGECCQRQRRYREAESHLERALARIPNLEPAQIALAELYLLRNDVDAARHIVDAQRSCHPAFRKRWIEAAAACDATSGWALRIDETADAAVQADQALTGIVSARNGALGGCPAAIAALVRLRSDAFARAPSMRVALAAGLTLPPCANTTIAVRDARSAYADAIAQLHEQCPQSRIATFEPALQHLSWSNFLLAYQGEDDHELQTHYGDWLAMAAGTLRPDLALSATRASGAKPRVGIVSGHWYDCTAGWYFESWIDALSALPIELEVVALGLVDDEFSANLQRRAARFVRIRGDADAVAEYLHRRGFDLLIYPEIGMYADLLPVAALRLAPMQWVAWGHPVTTGLPTIDRYLSCRDMEPEQAQAHYREALLALPGIGTRYRPPPAPLRAGKRELGLPEAPIVLVPQSVYKIHPDNDALYRQLLTSHPTLRILFVVSGRPWEATQLRDRIARGLDPAAAQRVVFVGFQPRASLLQLMSACDLMLDTLHWSGGNTTLDALRAGLPVLTTRGRFMRGRQSAAMLTQLGLEKELVCSIDEVVARVLSLLDSAELETLRARIAIGFNALVDGSDALQALSTAVVEALQLPFAATNPRSGLPPS